VAVLVGKYCCWERRRMGESARARAVRVRRKVNLRFIYIMVNEARWVD
jgi:hypothetical protein